MRTLAILLSAALVGSCGGDGGSCGKVPACGGDVVGTWRYEAFCGEAANLAFPALPCAQAKITSVQTSRSGTLTFGADGSFTEDATSTATFTLDVPGLCLSDGQSCQSFGDSFGRPGLKIDSMACSPTPGACRCTQVISGRVTSSGTATIDGTTLTLSAPDHLSSEFSYCVQGDELHLDFVVTPLSTGVPQLQLGAVARRISGP